MTAEEILEIIKQNDLEVTPVLRRDIIGRERPFPIIRTWTVRKIQRNSIGTNYSVHYVNGHSSLEDAIQGWLKYYGPNPQHGIQVGGTVLHKHLSEACGPALVCKIGLWWAVIRFNNREVGMSPLAELEAIPVTCQWGLDEDELPKIAAMNCDEP